MEKERDNDDKILPEDERREIGERFARLVEIMRRLLAPGGCPWDRKQTHHSLKPFLIEEAYEVLEAIDNYDFQELQEELGDLTLQIVFHSELARREGRFDIKDVLQSICQKMIHRHPHVFGTEEWASPEEVLRNWEELKKREKSTGHEDEKSSILDGIPRSLPALLRAHRIQDRAGRVGFDWEKMEDVYLKVLEELEELKEHLFSPRDERDNRELEEEFGDLLFALVNLARFLDIHPEEALQKTNEKFYRRFAYIEEEARRQGKSLKNMTLEEMDALWEEAKRKGI